MTTPTVLVVQHEDACPPALLGRGLEAAGCVLDVRRGHRDDPIPAGDAALAGHDAVVVLGGAMGADDDAEHAWLGPTKALVRTAVADGVPLLGVCLGHQLIASALGGRVVRNPRGRQSGVVAVGWESDRAQDALLGALPATSAVHFNDDVVEVLPPGAVRLATGPGGEVQAVRYAPSAWGVQCHPEADAAVFDGWPGTEPWRAEVAQAQDELAQEWAPLAARLAALAAARRAHRAG